MPRDRLSQDFETFSAVDIRKHGASRYLKDPSTEILMLAWAWNNGPVKQWVPAETVGLRSEYKSKRAYQFALQEDMPREVREGLQDRDVDKVGWNAGGFERPAWAHVVGLWTPIDEWRDTMVHALTMSLPGRLKLAGKALGLGEDLLKHTDGTALLNYWTRPRTTQTQTIDRYRNLPHHDRAKWNTFKLYNRQDVIAERAIGQEIEDFPMPDHELRLWFLDQEINERGIPINLDMVDNACRIIDQLIADRMEKLQLETGLDNPGSTAQLLPWLREHGYWFEDLKKGHVARAREKIDAEDLADGYDLPCRLSRVLAWRQEVSKSSVKKYKALQSLTDSDGALRNAFQFAGAGRTWRWAGRGWQPQNLAKPIKALEKKMVDVAADIERLNFEELSSKYHRPPSLKPSKDAGPMDVLSAGVRPVVQAPKGYRLAVADLNAIENRVLGWMARDEKILEVFRLNQDPYIAFAVYMYGLSYEEILAEHKAGNSTKRKVSKPAVLGCGYRLGPGIEYENERTGEMEATGLLGYAWNMGVKLTLEQAEKSVRVWRETFRRATEFWEEIGEAAHRCVRTGQRTYCDPVEFYRAGDWLRMLLPSGRCLSYHKPFIAMRPTPWGSRQLTLCYFQQNDRHEWVETRTHGGKLTENADQAIARDLLANGMALADDAGLDIRLHVHDEIGLLCRESRAERELKELIDCMMVVPRWAPGMPMGVAGYLCDVYMKE